MQPRARRSSETVPGPAAGPIMRLHAVSPADSACTQFGIDSCSYISECELSRTGCYLAAALGRCCVVPAVRSECFTQQQAHEVSASRSAANDALKRYRIMSHPAPEASPSDEVGTSHPSTLSRPSDGMQLHLSGIPHSTSLGSSLPVDGANPHALGRHHRRNSTVQEQRALRVKAQETERMLSLPRVRLCLAAHVHEPTSLWDPLHGHA